jgi:hypothetical protein
MGRERMKRNAVKTLLCPGCGCERKHSDYYKDRSRPSGCARLCKDCHKERMQIYWKTIYYPTHRAELIAKVLERRKKAGKKKEGK